MQNRDLNDGPVSLGLLVLRVGIGFFLAFSHGLPKLISFNERFHSFADPIGVGSEFSYILIVFAEFLCALLVSAGLFTRYSAIPPLIAMLVAAFIVHGDDPFGKKEFALLYAIPFLALIFTGGGRFSLDYLISQRGKNNGWN